MADGDPWPYTGALRRIDGVAPYNHHLWPLLADQYWANREIGNHLSSRWRFHAIALADGRWLAEMLVLEDEARMRFFPSREKALRSSAAEMLRTLRAARSWTGRDQISADYYASIVQWVRQVLRLPARQVAFFPTVSTPASWDDLPLFAADHL